MPSTHTETIEQIGDRDPMQRDNSQRPPRVLFFGMQNAFSSPSLHALLNAKIDVRAVILSSPHNLDGQVQPVLQRRVAPRVQRSMLPLFASSPDLLQLAWQRELPVWEVSNLSRPEVVQALSTYQPDLLCVSCFSRHIPRIIRELPRLGCLNVHPSLLPANRGPVPLFWTFREGQQQTGVTIHLLSEKMDSGDIIAQEMLAVPEGISYAALETQCAQLGASLLVQSVWKLYQGTAQPIPQDEAQSSYHSFPTSEDLVVRPEQWQARSLYNFIRGAHVWEYPIIALIDRQRYIIQNAISYSQRTGDAVAAPDELGVRSEYTLRCQDGWVHVQGDIIS